MSKVPDTQDTPEIPNGDGIGSDMLPITDLDQCITLLADWHNRQVATVNHLCTVPEGVKVVIGEGEEAKEQILEGKFLEGFQLGLNIALNYLGTLPFMAEYVDAPPTQH